MKRFLICFFVSAVATCSFANDYEYKFSLPYDVVDAVDTSKLVFGKDQYGNEISETIAYCQFTHSEEMTVLDATSSFAEKYNSLYGKMVNIISAKMTGKNASKLAESYAQANIDKWYRYCMNTIIDAIAQQQELDAKYVEDAKQDTEESMEIVNEAISEHSTRMATINGTLESQIAQITSVQAASIAKIAVYADQMRDDLEDEMEKLNEKIEQGASNKVIEELKAKAMKAATDAEAAKKVAERSEKVTNELQTQFQRFNASHSTVTNEMKRISRWLGYDEGVGGDNPGIFKKPLKPDESEYGETDNVLNYLDDYEMVGYSSISNQSMSVYPMRYCFAEQIDGDDTNVVSSFTAAKNWADGKTVICTNGMYSVHPDIQFLTNIVWATNWTEAVKHITKEETTNIVNVVTNLVNDYNTITTQVYKVEAFTNWYNMVNWTTNFILKVETNTNEIVDWTTNFVTVTSAITNKKEFVSFQTNVFNHSTFVTNTIENLRTIQNWTFVTNHIIRYLGGGQEGGETPTIDPKDDPYSPNYEPQPIDDYIIPTKNARLISAITNYPLSKINSDNLFDKKSIWTNNHLLAEIKGYWKAKKDQFPYKPADGDDVEIKWADFPWAATNTVDITTNDIDKVKKWLKKIEEKNIFNIVWTNANSLAELKTNFFNKVNAEDMLDNKSVWTNGNKLVEIKGFHKAKNNTIPVATVNSADRKIDWLLNSRTDSSAVFNIVSAQVTQMKTIDASDDFLLPTGNVYTVHGFIGANENQVPYKKKVGGSNGSYELAWKDLDTGYAIKLVGTASGNEVILGAPSSVTNTLTFASASDSNVSVTVGGNANAATVTIGVYYK